MSYAIGIDLGSTFSVVSYVNENDQAEVIPNDLGERITPSVVSFGDEVYIGQYAVDMEQHLPFSHTIRVVKRHMGTNKRFVIEDKSYSPEEISSYILKYLKNCAERHLGFEVTEAVSIGAAIQASVLTGKSSREVFLLDVCPLSLGVETQGGIMSTLISRNTQVPAVVKETFTTAYDNQSSVDVKICQGERPKTVDNLCLGEFKLDGIEKSPRGVPKIEVTFEIDANGILSVKAEDLDTGVEKDIEITGQASLSNEEISKIIDDAQKYKEEDEYFRKITNMHDLLHDCEIQVEELLRTNALSKEDIIDLNDLKISIQEDGKSQNIELLSSLLESAKDTIKEKSIKLHEIAKEKANI